MAMRIFGSFLQKMALDRKCDLNNIESMGHDARRGGWLPAARLQ
jgi:hypothetical protein